MVIRPRQEGCLSGQIHTTGRDHQGDEGPRGWQGYGARLEMDHQGEVGPASQSQEDSASRGKCVTARAADPSACDSRGPKGYERGRNREKLLVLYPSNLTASS